MRYSGFQVIKEALTGHKGWKPVWRDPEPQSHYDIIIIGGGGHGLATAYYLAKKHKRRSPCWKKAGLVGVTWAGTQRLSGPTICLMATSRSMKCH